MKGERPDGLTDKQTAFAREYVVDRNGTQAAIRAGYSERTANEQAARLLANVSVRAEINRMEAACAERVELTVAGITARLLLLADRAETIEGHAALNTSRQCLMDAAKLNGLVVETHETVARSPEERAARLTMLRQERERIARAH